MTVTVRLLKRDLSGSPLPLPPGVALSVASYSRAAEGGPKDAQIVVTGGRDSLSQAFSWLRCPVELTSAARANKLWWGYVSAVRLRLGQLELVMSLVDMANSVSVAYSRLDDQTSQAGARQTTADYTDAASVAEYGTKELRYTLNSATDAQAASVAATILRERRFPQSLGPSFGAGGTGEASVTLECVGWWQTLAWRRFADSARSESYSLVSGTDAANVTAAAGSTRLAQQFQLPNVSDAWTVDNISLLLIVANLTPVGTAMVELWSDSGGSPGAQLSYGSVLGAAIKDGASGVLTGVVMNVPVTITGATPYWIVLRKPGDATGGSYFSVRWNIASTYARGVSKWWTGSAWAATTAGEPYFAVHGVVETTQQIVAMVAAGGQFLSGTRILDVSGVFTSPLRSGDRTAQAEAEDLLAAGTISGQRVLATVTPERLVSLSAEPLPSDAPAYQLDGEMLLYDAQGNRASGESCPAGVWIALKNVLPPSANFSQLVVPSPFFAEEGRYDAQTGRYTPTPRGLGNVFAPPIQTRADELLAFIKPFVQSWLA